MDFLAIFSKVLKFVITKVAINFYICNITLFNEANFSKFNVKNLEHKIIIIKFACQKHIELKLMEIANPIIIPNPSKELAAFIEKAQHEKKVRMESICNKYRRLING